MGCYQSKEQVAETATAEAPPAEEVAAAETAPVEEAKPEDAPKEEEAAKAEEVEPAEAEAVAGAPKEEEAKPAEEAKEEEKPEVPKEEEAKPAEEAKEEAKPAGEVKEEAAKEEEAPKAEEEAKEPETEAKPVEEPEVDPVVAFEATGVKYGEKNVAFYTYKGVHKDDPAKEYELCKRYNDFKTLHEALVPVWGTEGKPLPALPHGGVISFLRGRKSKGIATTRETAFLDLLHAVARNPAAFESDAFQKFLAA